MTVEGCFPAKHSQSDLQERAYLRDRVTRVTFQGYQTQLKQPYGEISIPIWLLRINTYTFLTRNSSKIPDAFTVSTHS